MNFIQDVVQAGTAPIVGAAITAIVSINTLFLRWMLDSFKGLRGDIKDLAVSHQSQIDVHEEKDQVRHEENLKRFTTIAVALTRLDVNEEAKNRN